MGAQAAAALDAAVGLGTPPPGSEGPVTGSVGLGPLPPGLSLDAVARGHGAVAHPPSAYVGGVLHRVLAGPLAVAVRSERDGLTAAWTELGPVEPDRVRRSLRHQLALDDDLEPLWSACDAAPGFGWVRAAGAGRVLRAETVFEDVVGVLASARTSWVAARASLGRLVSAHSAPAPSGARAFPSPGSLAAVGPAGLRAAGLGFRAEWVAAAAERFAADDHARWLVGSDLSDAAVRSELLALPGIGAFGASTLAALLGRPRGAALDGWATRSLGLTGTTARERYAPLGRWAGTGLWLDLVRTRVGGADHRGEDAGAGRTP